MLSDGPGGAVRRRSVVAGRVITMNSLAYHDRRRHAGLVQPLISERYYQRGRCGRSSFTTSQPFACRGVST